MKASLLSTHLVLSTGCWCKGAKRRPIADGGAVTHHVPSLTPTTLPRQPLPPAATAAAALMQQLPLLLVVVMQLILLLLLLQLPPSLRLLLLLLRLQRPLPQAGRVLRSDQPVPCNQTLLKPGRQSSTCPLMPPARITRPTNATAAAAAAALCKCSAECNREGGRFPTSCCNSSSDELEPVTAGAAAAAAAGAECCGEHTAHR